MAFRVKRGSPLPREVRLLLNRQLSSAIACLEDQAHTSGRDAVHQARKHVKKARAVLRLVRGALGESFGRANERLRMANRLLGPLADSRAVLSTLDHLRDFDRTQLPDAVIAALHDELARRAGDLQARAEADRVRERLVRLLTAERNRAGRVTLSARGRLAVLPEIKAAHRAGRKGRDAAAERPTSEHFHDWRRRVKTEWYLVRLLADSCGGRLIDDQHRLEALDGCLGELHNVNVLLALVAGHSPLSRLDTARALRAMRAYRRDLERRVVPLGRFYDERPSSFTARVQALWGVPPVVAVGRPEWPRVA